MTAKTPYEVRLELLKLAQDQLNQNYYQKYDYSKFNAERSDVPLTEVPEFPNTQQILLEAEKLKAFVDGDNKKV